MNGQALTWRNFLLCLAMSLSVLILTSLWGLPQERGQFLIVSPRLVLLGELVLEEAHHVLEDVGVLAGVVITFSPSISEWPYVSTGKG